ncbi:MAG: DUF2190 family protein [Sulfuricurvum sp.]|nr:DUF2190 family protein [Sulfuricurvum sp.]
MAKEAIEVQEGDVIDYTLTADVVVGEVVPLGTSMIGVAVTAGKTGEVIGLKIENVFEINATTADAIDIGELVYFNTTTRAITETSVDNVRAGRAMSAKGAAVAGTVMVKINAA